MTNKIRKTIDTKNTFGFNCDFEVKGFQNKGEHTPEVDKNYCFDKQTTNAILAGLVFNKKVLIQGFHGTGKSTHIEQVAARLNWDCIRINLDGQISRLDLVGKDSIVLEDSKQITKFKDGIVTWSIRRPIILVLDEYDAARPDVMFVLQRLLEADSKFTLLDNNEVITPHPYFRIFATSNTIGLGDTSGLYHGVQPINQGQMDRWNIVTALNYLEEEDELKILLAKASHLKNQKKLARLMVKMANLTRIGFKLGDISTVMSPRSVINWAENYLIFKDLEKAFILSFLNKCDIDDKSIISEYYQRCFGQELEVA